MSFDWRCFSLDQVNHAAGESVNAWDRPNGFDSPGLQAFAASEAARRQTTSDGAWEAFHFALLDARHAGNHERFSPAMIERVAVAANLDVVRLRQDAADPSVLERVAQNHLEAVAQGIFGTPTLVFKNGRAGYVKMQPAPTGDEAMEAWWQISTLISQRDYVTEIKRPRRPRTV